MLCLGRLCGLMPAGSVGTGDMALVPGLLVGLELEEGASVSGGSLVSCYHVVCVLWPHVIQGAATKFQSLKCLSL